MDFSIGKAILKAREQRYLVKTAMIEGGGTLIEMASIMPGSDKQHAGLAQIFEDGLRELTVHLNLGVNAIMDDCAGYYALARSPLDGVTCKRLAVALEEQYPWNRLLDIDCFVLGNAVTRSSMGFPERKCLVCGDVHSECIYEKRHPIELVSSSAHQLIDSYFLSSTTLVEPRLKENAEMSSPNLILRL
ncbi:citrate lyase holo-[acyl-carrier protein] synthase [Vibrio mimicus]